MGNVSPILQRLVTMTDCVFPMSTERFREIQKSARLDILQFTKEDYFDLLPDIETNVCVSLKLSQCASVTDPQMDQPLKPPEMSNGGSCPPLPRKRSSSTVLASSSKERMWLQFVHSTFARPVRYSLA